MEEKMKIYHRERRAATDAKQRQDFQSTYAKKGRPRRLAFGVTLSCPTKVTRSFLLQATSSLSSLCYLWFHYRF